MPVCITTWFNPQNLKSLKQLFPVISKTDLVILSSTSLINVTYILYIENTQIPEQKFEDHTN